MDLSKLTREQAAAIAEITVEDFMDGRGEEARAIRRIKFKLHDKQGALVALGKHLGMKDGQFTLLPFNLHEMGPNDLMIFREIVLKYGANGQPGSHGAPQSSQALPPADAS